MSSSFKTVSPDVPALNDVDAASAVRDLVVDKFEYIKVNRHFVDPPMGYQEPKFALFSFIPTRDDKKIIGVGKIRGVFHTAKEANERAEHIVKTVDSEHSIFTTLVGVPFPLVDTGFSKDVKEVDIDELSSQTNEKLKFEEKEKKLEQKLDEERAKKKREEIAAGEIEDDIKPEGLDQYVLNRVKLAQFYDRKLQYRDKMREMELAIEDVKEKLKEMYAENPDYEQQYMDKYTESRRKAHIPEEMDLDGFGKYMTLPINFDDDDTRPSRKRRQNAAE